jgi:hypothetical protein
MAGGDGRRQVQVPVSVQVAVQGANQTVGLPRWLGFGVTSGSAEDADEIELCSDPRRAASVPGRVRKRVSLDGLPNLVSQMQPSGFADVVAHPLRIFNMGLRCCFEPGPR